MLSQDNPQYKKKGPKVNSKSNPNPYDHRPVQVKNIAYNPYASGDNAPSDKWGKGLMSSPLGTSHLNAWKKQNSGLMGETSNAPEIRHAPLSAPATRSPPVISTPVIRAPVSSSLSVEPQQASERLHRYRTDTSRNTAPVPGSDNESSQDDDDSLFDDQLLPPEKSKILRLRKEIRIIKGGVIYPTGYERDRARAIKEAEANRLEGKLVPDYLDGTKTPWSSGMGQANEHYDDNEVAKREAKIEKIKRLNAEHCQQEHIANIPSIERKGGPGGQVQG
jgi:hypothetical protein